MNSGGTEGPHNDGRGKESQGELIWLKDLALFLAVGQNRPVEIWNATTCKSQDWYLLEISWLGIFNDCAAYVCYRLEVREGYILTGNLDMRMKEEKD
jgi:hypothetical protein